MSEVLNAPPIVQPVEKVLFDDGKPVYTQLRDFSAPETRALFVGKSFKQVAKELRLTDELVDTNTDDEDTRTFILIRNNGIEYAIMASKAMHDQWEDYAKETSKFAKCVFTETHPFVRNANGELLDANGNVTTDIKEAVNDLSVTMLRFGLPNELKGARESMFGAQANNEAS